MLLMTSIQDLLDDRGRHKRHQANKHIDENQGSRMGGGSDGTMTRVALAKKMIENYYADMKAEREEAAIRVNEAVGLSAKKSAAAQEIKAMRERRRVLTINDFEEVAILGKGSYGEVVLVRKDEGESAKEDRLYALKKIAKSETVRGDRLGRVLAERKMLAFAESEWFCRLHYAFHDEQFFYLAMEFLQGGDLLGMLIQKDVLQEDEARFYMAELVTAVDSMHRLGFIHRDVKPDNVLFDRSGHLKLSDFGLCKALADAGETYETVERSNDDCGGEKLRRMSSTQRRALWKAVARKKNFTSVGTPNYVAPEVLMHSSYGEECDWWSVGAVLYETLFGYPPFHSDTPEETCRKITNWRRYLTFPKSSGVSPEAEDLVRSLLTTHDIRLGAREGLDEFKKHPFFNGVDWDTLRDQDPPFQPVFTSSEDLRYFDSHYPLTEIRLGASSNHASSSDMSSSTMNSGDDQLKKRSSRTSLRRLGHVIEEDLQLVGFSLSKRCSFGSECSESAAFSAPQVIPHAWG